MKRAAAARQAPQLPDQSLLPTVEGTMDYVHHRGRVLYGRQLELARGGPELNQVTTATGHRS